jgi:hypothetical protein
MALRRYEMNMNIRVNRMRNGLSKLCESNNENMTECLQRYVVFGYERI